MITTKPQSNFMTLEEASEFLQVSERTLFRWILQKRIQVFRVGNITRIAQSDLDLFIKENTHNRRVDA